MRKVTVTLEVEIPRGPYCHEFATDTTCRRFDDGEKYEPSGMFEHEDRCELFDIKLVRLEDLEWRYPYPHKVYRCTKCLALDKKKLIRNKSTKRSRAFWEDEGRDYTEPRTL